LARKAPRSKATVEQLDKLEENIELLKVAYDRYFNGVDRVPPARDHDSLKRSLHVLMRNQLPSTVLRFRFQNLRARLITYEQYWTRILIQIEKGTFKWVLAESERRAAVARQKAREERAAAKRAAENPSEAAPPEPGAPRAVKRRPSAPRPAADLPDGMDAKTARNLFRDFVKAKRAAGEQTEGITYGGLVKKLSREMPKLQKKHGDEVRFEVATVNGKVRLRARSNRG
jgi:hypothetical protein